MRLKRLEISGFKTFRDKAILDFSPGISGVVGPNGCGKSNIVDAIRWVMGEQRVKMLRGKRMDDVVFNGAEGAPPVGLAEVTVTLDCNGKPFQGAYEGCSEVMVSRRLFREGESEYCINQVPCRLLDVKEFFMDTGVGARTYSLVEQNSVSNLVEAKPEERRQFIEEAAGIAKYKSRKEAALRKMEATRQNMVRLHDIIREVKSQLNAVTRQAKRAEQYRNLKKEISDAEVSLALLSYSELKDKKISLERDKEALLKKAAMLGTELKTRDAGFEEMKLAALENEGTAAECHNKLYETKNAINMKEQGIEFSKGKIADIGLQKQRDLAEVRAREGKLEEIAKELETLKAAEEETAREIDEAREALNAAGMKLEELKKADNVLYEELEENKIVYIDIVAEKAKLKNAELNLARILDDIGRRKEKHSKEKDENVKRREDLCAVMNELRSGLTTDEERQGELKERRNILSNSAEDAKSRLKETEDKISVLKEETGRKSARLSSLRELHEGYAWCSEGIKSLMTAKKQGRLNELESGEFLGLVADYIDVPREHETAVEAVLGDKLQYVVVKSQEDGIRAIDYLRTSAKGRGTFVPLAVRNHGADPPLADHLKETVRLIEQVKVQDDFKDVISYLLGDVLLTPSLQAGVSLWRQNGFKGTFVTPEGDIINSQGLLTGGSSAKEGKSFLGNKREMADLKSALSDLGRELERAAAEKIEINNSICQWEEELRILEAELRRLEIQINGRHKDIERFEDELKRTDQRIGIIGFDHETLLTEEKEAEEKLEDIKKALVIQHERENIVNDSMADSKEKREALRTELERWERDFTAGRVLLAAREEKREGDRKTSVRLEETKEALIREIKDRQRDAETSDAQVGELLSRIAAEKEILEVLYGEHQALEERLAEMKAEQQGKEELLRFWEKETKEIRQGLEQVEKEASEREISLREVAFKSEALKGSMEGRHHVNMDALFEGYSPVEEDLSGETAAKLEKARQTLESFGEVNLLALNEYEELKGRYDFLTAQEADIRVSLDSLQRTIERMNSISRKRFAETFEAVNQSFKDMFTRIFPGGKGELKLTDSADMLETGVEIDIQIPGKRVQNITLLSGGEKSLAAIALIFAILQYRPSPFLVLDEVDAALDDANIALFNKLLRDISKNSQIIMVTHNKKTMEAAENLFGVTMQNQGISTLVSVSLN